MVCGTHRCTILDSVYKSCEVIKLDEIITIIMIITIINRSPSVVRRVTITDRSVFFYGKKIYLYIYIV